MKFTIEPPETKFRPVAITITLETEKELSAFRYAIGGSLNLSECGHEDKELYETLLRLERRK